MNKKDRSQSILFKHHEINEAFSETHALATSRISMGMVIPTSYRKTLLPIGAGSGACLTIGFILVRIQTGQVTRMAATFDR